MSERSALDNVSGGLTGLALLGGVVALFYEPFLFAPLGAVLLVLGVLISGRYRRLSLATALMLVLFFVIGAAVAVWGSRSLY